MKNDVLLLDLECYPNYFEVGIKNFKTKEVINYEVSEHIDNRIEIFNFISKYDGYLVTFNGLHYDCMLLKYLIIHSKTLKSVSKNKFLHSLKKFSDVVIDADLYWEQLKKYKYEKTQWVDIDLYCYWSKMLRLSKKISLKSLGIQLGYPVVQELPYESNTHLTKSQIDEVRNYNNKHDLGILDALMQKMLPDITLRKVIKKDYNLDCMSWDAIKISSEALLQDYCNETNQNPNDVRKLKWEKPTIYINELLSDFDPQFKLPIFQKLYERVLNSVDEFSEELVVNERNTSLILSYGVGGLHNLFSNKMYDSDDKYQIVTSDVGSLYPNLIINYKCVRFLEVLNRYISIKAERMAAKKAKRKNEDSFKKLILNGFSGLLDQSVSWLYYPEGALRMRLIGQLILTKTIEECILNNWQVISANTDGIEVVVPKKELNKYYETIDNVGKLFNLEFEHEKYKFIYYVNVNNYIALTENEKIKRKGLFKLKSEIPLGDAVNELIIPQMLSNYFINKIPIEYTVSHPEEFGLSVLDYCKSNKISKKDYEVIWNNQKVQNLNRYYFANAAPYLFKKRKESSLKYKGKSNLEHLNAGWGVMLYNKHVEKPFSEYNINYKYYISECNKIINELTQDKRQLSFF